MSDDPRQDLRSMDWRDRYEYEAKREADSVASLSEAQLLDRLRAGRLDPYFAIWRAFGRKGTVERSAPALWTFLRDHPGQAHTLNRFHCAAALFRLLGTDDPACENDLRKRVQWGHDGEEARQEALLELRAMIESLQRRDDQGRPLGEAADR